MVKLTIRNLSRTLKYNQEKAFYGKKLYGNYREFKSYKYIHSLGLLNGEEDFVYGKVAVELTPEEFIVFIKAYNEDLTRKMGVSIMESKEIQDLMGNTDHKLLLWE